MTQIYIIKDKTDANIRKPFVGIFKNEQQAQQKVASLQSKLNLSAKNLISVESVEVTDFDANKTAVYIVYDKTDSNHKNPFMSMHFELANVEKRLKTLRGKVAPHAQKLIFAQMEKIV